MSNASDFVIENGVLKKYTGNDENVVVPDEVRILGDRCFDECRKIKSISLSENIESIGENVFSFCVDLKKLNIPSKIVTDRFDLCMNNCWRLKELILPQGITVKEGEYWFDGGWLCLEGCNQLKILVAPSVSPFDIHKRAQYAAAKGFLTYRNKFSNLKIISDYEEYFIKRKKMFMDDIFDEDLVEGIKIIAKQNKITVKNFDSDFFDPAIEKKATACIAFLLDWKNENIPSEKYEKQVEREFSKDPFNASDMKKIWSAENLPDGSLLIKSYKGKEKDIKIPERIGKKAVTVIGDDVFSHWNFGFPEKKRVLMEKITFVAIPEGITQVGKEIFCGCHNLNTVILPSSLVKIGCRAFEDCPNLTIHAPAGSYAETYAKENNIPFVAE